MLEVFHDGLASCDLWCVFEVGRIYSCGGSNGRHVCSHVNLITLRSAGMETCACLPWWHLCMLPCAVLLSVVMFLVCFQWSMCHVCFYVGCTCWCVRVYVHACVCVSLVCRDTPCKRCRRSIYLWVHVSVINKFIYLLTFNFGLNMFLLDNNNLH